jgi:hypothetical protein
VKEKYKVAKAAAAVAVAITTTISEKREKSKYEKKSALVSFNSKTHFAEIIKFIFT